MNLTLSLMTGAALLISAAFYPAQSETYTITAPEFNAPSTPATIEALNQGFISSSSDVPLFAALPFQGKGQICNVTMNYVRKDGTAPIVVTLFRKSFELGESSNKNPTEMTTVRSSRNASDIILETTSTFFVTKQQIDTSRFSYFFRISFPDSGQANLFSLRSEILDRC